jgi:hypothetical protein
MPVKYQCISVDLVCRIYGSVWQIWKRMDTGNWDDLMLGGDINTLPSQHPYGYKMNGFLCDLELKLSEA